MARPAGKTEVQARARTRQPGKFGRVLLVVAAALALGSGCAEVPLPYQTVASAKPNPFVHAPRFAVAPIDFEKLTVHGESFDRWAARQDAGKMTAFERDKDAINQSFAKALLESAHAKGFDVVPMGSAEAGPFVIEPAVKDLDPGVTTFAGSSPSGLKMRVVVKSAGGKRLDEIEIAHAGGGNDAALGQQHLAGDAAAIAEVIADYLSMRVTGTP